jgi:Arc/MetJ family transcription regulator
VTRTNIDLDDQKVTLVMQRYGLRTKRAAVDRALTEMVGRFQRRDMLDLLGTGWDGDLDELRRQRS